MSDWLSTQDAARYVGYSVKSLSRFCRLGMVQHSRVTSKSPYRFRREWLDEFLARNCRTPDIQPIAVPRRHSRSRLSESLIAAIEKKRSRDTKIVSNGS
jgi:hypothetical protein